ncbi:MAG TPA: hypothetical protein EYP57_06430 [Thermodesulfobacteriaceae bacterium]|nr:hypothetical protein [Thermodesulfobacteriaceae bacterium]
MFRNISGLLACLAALSMLVCGSMASAGAQKDYSNQEKLVEDATNTFNALIRDPAMGWVRSNLKKAKGIFIIPQSLKGGFMFGAEGGSGLVLTRDDKTGHWSYPAFYTMGSVSFGFQIGGQASEIILLVMTQKGMDALLSPSFKLGADVSIAAGPLGGGAAAQTADILAFAKSKGAFGGISIQGAVITSRDKWNKAYYGRSARAVDILIRHAVRNSHADRLREAVTAHAKP